MFYFLSLHFRKYTIFLFINTLKRFPCQFFEFPQAWWWLRNWWNWWKLIFIFTVFVKQKQQAATFVIDFTEESN